MHGFGLLFTNVLGFGDHHRAAPQAVCDICFRLATEKASWGVLVVDSCQVTLGPGGS